MTIYIPGRRELPRDQMAKLAPGARFSVTEADGSVTAFVYEWDDVTIVANIMPDSELSEHLDGFVGWVRSVAAAKGGSPAESLVQRIRSTALVLGFVVEGATDRDVWHDRVEDIIAMICFNTRALLFWEGGVFDENLERLLPVA